MLKQTLLTPSQLEEVEFEDEFAGKCVNNL